MNDIDAAVEEVSGRDCDWEMVYYVSIDHEVGEDDDDDEDDDDYSFDSSNTYQPPQPQIAESTKRSGFDFF